MYFQSINKSQKNFKGFITHDNIKWTLPSKKLVKDIHKVGDIIFLKKKIIFGKLNNFLL